MDNIPSLLSLVQILSHQHSLYQVRIVMNVTSKLVKFVRVCLVNKADFHMIIAFPSKEYFINYVVICVVNVFLTFSTIFLNALTVLLYWKSSQLQKKTSYFLVYLLSLNDLAVGVFSNTLFCMLFFSNFLGYEECLLASWFNISSFFLTGISLGTLFVLSFERYLSIVYPVYHRNKATKRNFLKVTLTVWIVTITAACIWIAKGTLGRNLTGATLCLSLIALVYMYAKIFLSSRRIAVYPTSTNSEKNGKRFLQQMKKAKSCLIVVCCTTLCYLPAAVNGFFQQTDFAAVMLRGYWCSTLILLASSLNSGIFFWRNLMLRNEAKKILLKS